MFPSYELIKNQIKLGNTIIRKGKVFGKYNITINKAVVRHKKSSAITRAYKETQLFSWHAKFLERFEKIPKFKLIFTSPALVIILFTSRINTATMN